MPSSSSSNNRIVENDYPAKKKARLLSTATKITAGNSSTLKKKCYSTPQWLLHNDDEVSDSPVTIFGSGDGGTSADGRVAFKIRQDHDKLQRLLVKHRFRTSKILSPHQAVSVYKDSCQMTNDDDNNNNKNEQDDANIRDGREFLLVCFGFHRKQEEIEKDYRLFVRDAYCIILFCQKIRKVFNFKSLKKKNDTSDEYVENVDKDIKILFNKIEHTCRQHMKKIQQNDDDDDDTVNVHGSISSCSSRSYAEERVDELIQLATNIKGRQHNFHRVEEWKKEYQRIYVSNSTLSNAYITLLQSTHEMYIKDIFFKFSKHEQSKYERITIYLSNDHANNEGRCHRSSDLFLFLPCLHTVVTKGPLQLVSDMIESFWSHVLRDGYFPTTRIKESLDSQLRQFFLSGIVATSITANNPIRDATKLPLPLKANFNPTYPLSIYLHGKAGVGKSSLAKVLPVALQSTIEQHLDPECIARFVKQNLNKSMNTLELELEIRPNNNNLSVMSIVQSRRMAMSQSKPGLVVLNFEEMPMYSSQSNPNQLSVAQLISQRFGGRTGDYRQQQQQQQQGNTSISGSMKNKSAAAPRNSDKRSIGRDFSLVTIFTSNYLLHEDSKLALQQLELYQYLEPIEMIPISGADRCQFAESYLVQCLVDSLETNDCADISTGNISLDIITSDSDGDTRPLVRQLRMFAFYLRKLIRNDIVQKKGGQVIIKGIQVSRKEDNCYLTVESKIDGGTTSRKSSQHLKTGSLSNWYPIGPFIFDSRVESVSKKLKLMVEDAAATITELAFILEFWFSMTLAPAVILSRDKKVIQQLMDAIASIGDDVHCIRNINTPTYKMVKSLYDPKDIPNLRDDILKFGRGALVAVELNCPTEDSQLCSREMIEDSPSMTAFSTTKSALYKSGLLFAIHVEGEVTPEVMSRVSFVL